MSNIELSALDKALETIDGVVDRINANKRAEEAMLAVEDCRFRAALGERSAARAFFTSLALALVPQVDSTDETETASTDGKRLIFNPEWMLGLKPEERYGVVIGHEPMHCAMEHFARMRGMDDDEAAQIAADLEINPICREAGFDLPQEAIFPGEGEYQDIPPGKTIEEYYGLLKQKKPEPQGEDGPGDKGKSGSDPGGCGGVMPAPDQAQAEHQANTWKGRVAAAAQAASQRGDLPTSLQRWVDEILQPKVDPWEILREYMTRAVKAGEQQWARPNRRVLSQGLYLPTRRTNELGDVVLLVDTSGSISDKQLALIAGFLEGVLSANPGKLTVIYHTTDVYDVVEWVPEGGPLSLTKGKSGGTSHVPAFQEIENRGIEPAVILAATDLETRFPDDPGIPTIWVDVEGRHTPPFGQYVCIA